MFQTSMAAEVGSKVPDLLRLVSLEGIPSRRQFSSHIEPSNVPAVFRGAVKDWEAYARWNPQSGGLEYLEEKVGAVSVEVMHSESAPVFYGDLRSHERVPMPFSAFIASCKSCTCIGSTSQSDEPVLSKSTQSDIEDDYLNFEPSPNQIYLAQVPILNSESKEIPALAILADDLHVPLFLEAKELVSINFWMNSTQSRSSTHYDPHHNLLCVISGCKQVFLWPPSSSPLLYPMPIYGEASNHSAVDMLCPDLTLHPRSKYAPDYCQKIVLGAGDALFLPEGWFHQVDSDDLTIAVNFWWQSHLMSNMLQHMDSYYLRRIINRMVGKEMEEILRRSSYDDTTENDRLGSSSDALQGDNIPQNGVDESRENTPENILASENLKTLSCQALHQLVSLVHHKVNSDQSPDMKHMSVKESEIKLRDDLEQRSTAKYVLEDDPVAGLLWELKPLVCQKTLLAMAHDFPRTLEALVLHVLSPVAAEVLTRKFDEMDHITSKKELNDFYQRFYSVFDDQFAVMDTILAGKETFAFQAFKDVIEQHLGVHIKESR